MNATNIFKGIGVPEDMMRGTNCPPVTEEEMKSFKKAVEKRQRAEMSIMLMEGES